MKKITTPLKLAFLILIFIQVRMLKAVAFWKHQWPFDVWLTHRNKDGKNDLLMNDLSVLLGFYVHVGFLWIGWFIGFTWFFATAMVAGHSMNYFVFVRPKSM